MFNTKRHRDVAEAIQDFSCPLFELQYVMLTDSADWDAAVWDMDIRQLPRLARAIDEVGRRLDHFTFRVAWSGEDTVKRVPIPADDLVKLIRENKIGNRVEYQVGFSDAGKTRSGSVARLD